MTTHYSIATALRSSNLLDFELSLRKNDQDRFQDPFQSETLPPGRQRQDPLLELSCSPKNASAKLPSRGMTAIEGTLNGFPFQGTLEPERPKKPLAQSGP